MDHDIDVEELIGLVESHPSIWDKTMHEYKNRMTTLTAWRDVCATLNPEFAGFTENEKNVYGKRVLNKWRNVKDQWLKRCRQVTAQKRTGTGKRLMKPYYYHEQLRFLEKCMDGIESEGEDGSSSPVIFNYLPEIMPPQASHKRPALADAEADSKKIKADLDDRILFTPLPLDEEPMVLFIKGVLPSMRDFSDEETLEFQSGVLSVILNIKRGRAFQHDKWAGVPDPGNADPSQPQPSASSRPGLRASRRMANVAQHDYSDSFE